MGKYQVSNAHFRGSHLNWLYDKTNYIGMYLHFTTREEYTGISVDIPLRLYIIIDLRFSLYLLADSKLWYKKYSKRHRPKRISQYKAMFNFIWQRQGGVNKLYKGEGVRERKCTKYGVGPSQLFISTNSKFLSWEYALSDNLYIYININAIPPVHQVQEVKINKSPYFLYLNIAIKYIFPT